jgi:PAS domain S-box-containing protein
MAFTGRARSAAGLRGGRARRIAQPRPSALARLKAELEAAREEADRLRFLLEEASRNLFEAERTGEFGHWIDDYTAQMLSWSPQMFEITGLPPQPVPPLDPSQLPLHPDDRAHLFEVRRRAIESGETVMAEVRFVRPDGEIRWAHLVMRADYDAAGRLARMFGTAQDITERKRNEEDPKAAREQLVDAIESISEGFALFDRDERFILTNSTYTTMFPYLGERIAPGTPYRRMIEASVDSGASEAAGEDRETAIRRRLEAFRDCAESREVRFSDGRWIRMAERRTRDGGIVAIRTDITARKRAEAALQAAREQLADAVEAIPDGFVLFDSDDRYVLTNGNYRQLYPGIEDLCTPGRSFESAMEAMSRRTTHEIGPGGGEAWFLRIMEWHRACNQPMEQQLTDGRWIRAIERRTRHGGIAGIRTDITEIKTAEAALAAARDAAESRATQLALSEARFRDFALTASHWLWETDEQHRFVYVSEGARRHRVSPGPEALPGRSRLQIALDAGMDTETWRAHQTVLDRHEPFRDVVCAWRNDAGEEGIVSVSGDPLFDASGRFLGYRGTGRDVTEQVRAESALREAKLAAEAASRAKSQFLANMSHELRTPLNAILGFSEMIARGLEGSGMENYREYANYIHQSGRHLHEIINDILDLAKVDAGRFELRTETRVDPCRIAEACLALVRGPAEDGGVRLVYEAAKNLPLLVADSTRLKQILLNLLSNAIKFTPPGGSAAIAVRQAEDGGVVFEVRDTGPGMTPSEIEIALEPFGQIDTGYTRKQEGTGLGLPLARRLTELHGGTLSIRSEKGRGTMVSVRLPTAAVRQRA